MNDNRVPCPRCRQDWLLDVRLVYLKQDAVFCPECNAFWLQGDDINMETFQDYNTYMIEHGRTNPQDQKELLIRGPLLV